MSTNDFTDNYKKKLDELKNYDDSEVKDTLNTHSTKIAKFEQQKNNLSKQMPWNTVQGTSLHIEDSAEWDENSLSIAGNLKQEKREGYNLAKIVRTLKAVSGGIPSGNSSGGTINSIDDNNINFKITSQYAGFIIEPIEVKSGETIYASFNLSGGNSTIRQAFVKVNEDGSYTSLVLNADVADGKVKKTYTATEDLKIIFELYTKNDTTYTIDVKELMIAKKDNLMFEQYGAMPSTKYPSMPKVATGVQKIKVNDDIVETLDLGSTELCKIKDNNGNIIAQDKAVYKDNKWQWEKNVGKVIFNGTEDWNNIENAKINTRLYGLNNFEINCNYNEICSHFKTGKSFYGLDEEGLYLTTSGARIRFDLDKATNSIEFKTWLSNNNITVYYVLATLEYTDCTEAQSTILDKLYNNFKLQKGVNNIIVESDNGVGVEMDLSYMQDLQTKLNLLEAMIVSNASQEV